MTRSWLIGVAAISLAGATLTSLAAPHASEIQTRTSAEPVENTRRVRPVGDADPQFPVVVRMSEVSYPDSLTVELQPANKRPLGEDEEFLRGFFLANASSSGGSVGASTRLTVSANCAVLPATSLPW